MKIKAEIIAFEASDGLILQGLLYNPGRSKKVMIYTHGCGSSSIFNNPDFINQAGVEFCKAGLALFAFNNRGSYALHWRKKKISASKSEKIIAGAGFELIKECVFDLDGAIKLMKKLGFTEITLCGHSSGANKIAVYDFLKNGKTSVRKYILYGGGDDSGIFKRELGKKFEHYLKICKQKIMKGQGQNYIPLSWLKRPYSYQALADIMEPEGLYDVFPFNSAKRKIKPAHFQMLAKIKKPTLFIYGDSDPVNYLPITDCLQLIQRKLKKKKNFKYSLVPNGDHSCSGVERKLFHEWIKFLN